MGTRRLTATEVADGLASFIDRAETDQEREALVIALDVPEWETRAVDEWTPEPPPVILGRNSPSPGHVREWARQCREAADAWTEDMGESARTLLDRRAHAAEAALDKLAGA